MPLRSPFTLHVLWASSWTYIVSVLNKKPHAQQEMLTLPSHLVSPSLLELGLCSTSSVSSILFFQCDICLVLSHLDSGLNNGSEANLFRGWWGGLYASFGVNCLHLLIWFKPRTRTMTDAHICEKFPSYIRLLNIVIACFPIWYGWKPIRETTWEEPNPAKLFNFVGMVDYKPWTYWL